jgi:hypothetical protein
MTQSMIKRGAKTCSRRCYRAFMADRFDRHIGSVETLATISNYDEFLSRDKLTCLVPGCLWTGQSLSLHMNYSHGITEDEVKAKAGFNINTSLIAAPMLANLQSRGATGTVAALERARPSRKGQKQETRREAKTHLHKAAVIREQMKRIFAEAS